MQRVTVVKIGGNVIDNEALLAQFLDDFNALPGAKILIHGGGAIASKISKGLGIEVTMHQGRRVTDARTLEVVMMTYAGLIGKRIVAALQSRGCNALGMSGADGNLLKAKRREANPIDWCFVGDVIPDSVNTELLVSLLNQGIVPVVCALTHDGEGSMLNTNADTMASTLAVAISKEFKSRLLYCFEKRGVLMDADDDDSVIPLINRENYAQLLGQGVVNGGMIPKLDNAFAALESGVEEVVIKHAENLGNDTQTLIIL